MDVSEIRVEDTADFALKLFSTVDLMRKNNKAGKRAYFAAVSAHQRTDMDGTYCSTYNTQRIRNIFYLRVPVACIYDTYAQYEGPLRDMVDVKPRRCCKLKRGKIIIIRRSCLRLDSSNEVRRCVADFKIGRENVVTMASADCCSEEDCTHTIT